MIMNRHFLSFAAALVAVAAQAQSHLTATLSHDGQQQVFSGAEALKQAHEAAASGDVITLSPGVFTAVDIKKGITLHGAGINVSNPTKSLTRLNGDFSLSVPEEAGVFNMEGIFHNDYLSIDTLVNAQITRCRLYTIGCGISFAIDIRGINFVHCKIANKCCLESGTANFLNCYIHMIDDNGANSYILSNCVLRWRGTGLRNSSITNCIVLDGTYALDPTNMVSYSMASNEGLSDVVTTANNYPMSTDTDWVGTVFKTLTAATEYAYSDTETYELKEEAARNYLGEDGTQIGMYGGNMPFTMELSYPEITRFDVDSKSSTDGTLQVNVEVKTK